MGVQPGYAPQAGPQPMKKRGVPTWVKYAGIGVASFIIGVGAGGGTKSANTSNSTTAAPTVTVTAPGAQAAAPAPVTVTVTAPAAAPAAPVAGVPTQGTQLVGSEVAPGTYRAAGSLCYWARLSGTSGTFEEILANNNGPGVVTILASDKAFKSARCDWSKVG